MKDTKFFLKKKKRKGEKRYETDIKIFLKKKKKKSLSIIMIEIRIFLKKKNQKELVTSRFELLTCGIELHNMWICARNS